MPHHIFARGIFFALSLWIVWHCFNENPVPGKIRLFQNFPNPFKTNTRIDFTAPASSQVELTVYDESGKLLLTLFKEKVNTELHSVSFINNYLMEGIYIYSLRVENTVLSKKMNIFCREQKQPKLC